MTIKSASEMLEILQKLDREDRTCQDCDEALTYVFLKIQNLMEEMEVQIPLCRKCLLLRCPNLEEYLSEIKL
jgi:hypothetical protein